MDKIAFVVFCVTALIAILGLAFSFTGLGLFCIWEFAVRAAWPSLPYITWWQLGLMAFGIMWVGNLIRGGTVKCGND